MDSFVVYLLALVTGNSRPPCGDMQTDF